MSDGSHEPVIFQPFSGTPYALPNGALQRKKPIAEGEEEKKRKPRVRVRDKAYMAEAMRRYRMKKKMQVEKALVACSSDM